MAQQPDRRRITKGVYKKSEVTRKKIYETGIKLMEERGFQGTTIRDICEKAEVSVGTFYFYYKTKSDILRDIYLSADSYFYEVIAKQIEGKDCVEQLRVFIAHYAKLTTGTGINVAKVLFNSDNEWFAQTRPMQVVLSHIIAQGQAEGVLRADYERDGLVDFVFCLLRGISYAWCVSNGNFDLEQRIMEQFPLLMNGLGLGQVDYVQLERIES